MISRTGSGFDIILVTAEYYDDHPLSPVGVIARVLDAAGYRVGIIEKPDGESDFTRLGEPALFFGVTSGSLDSMVNNYTALKRKRERDLHTASGNAMPDRALIVYCNQLRRFFRNAPLVIGGVEASMRRFAHYDYWENRVRRSILLDSRADILVYGNGEKQILEIAARLRSGRPLDGVEGTCIVGREADSSFELLPSFEEVAADPVRFCRMQTALSNRKNLAQPHQENRLVLQYRYPRYTPEDLGRYYSLPYSRELHPASLLKMAAFSVVTHRGCIGNCRFCALPLHQGDRVISRPEESILEEVAALTGHPGFKGYVDDLGGPSANMYGMDCEPDCEGECLACPNLDTSHGRLIGLMRRARAIPGVKKVFVRSGIRYDLAVGSLEYIRELSDHHVSGCLKIAPEHFSPQVLRLMNKHNARFEEFVETFRSLNRDGKQALRYYFLIAHPGDDPEQLRFLTDRARHLENVEQFQLFTPTPMTPSTCMYWTGLDPFTLSPVAVVRDFKTKKEMKRMMVAALRGGRGRR